MTQLNVQFIQTDQSFQTNFGQINNVSDGGYERGYNAGYANGSADGYNTGYSAGLAARTYETWTITLIDGTIVEKEVALL